MGRVYRGSCLNSCACRFDDSAGHREHFRQPKIQNLCVPALSDKDVGGFDITVDDAFGVSGIESVGNFDSQRQQHLGLEWPSRDAVLQGRAIQILHHDEGTAFVLAEIVDGANAGVIEGRGSASFSAETLQRYCIFG